ncbi:MAG TPA: HAD-IIA family hydrolase [Tepidisphaeraceae bacterium]|jgi:4-nitrophenyl phosphatase|nr:HAD-IIA family hydrolase [Tepidisphaeraceae bacterium]
MTYDLSKFAAVFLDLDGTVFQEEHPLPGAANLVRHFNASGRKYACLTNHTFSARRIAQRLARIQIPIDAQHIYTAGDAAADYVMTRFGPRPRVYNLATESFEESLEGRVDWVNHATDPCDVVVNGSPICVYSTPDRQHVALELLKRGATLLGMCADRIYPSARGLEIGVGALSVMLGYAANVTPVFTGKPQPVFFRALCDRLQVDPKDCVLIGDNLESDIAGAKSVGMTALLTLTGVTKQEDLRHVDACHQPDGIIQSLADFDPLK